jgi:hypothetical protein
MKPKTAVWIGLGILVIAVLVWPVYITNHPAKRQAQHIHAAVNNIAKPFPDFSH